MEYMTVSGNDRNPAHCSDNDCPCGNPGVAIPPGEGYVFVSKKVVKFRKDCPDEEWAITTLQLIHKDKALDIIKEVNALRLDCPTGEEFLRKKKLEKARWDSVMIGALREVTPILMCEQGARKRNLDLAVASADAKHWWATGEVPLRPTPLAGSMQSDPDSKPGFWKRLFGGA